jgi:hypothetical protein
MPERVTREEKSVELAILKAKEVLQEAQNLGIIPLDEPSMGEDVKVKRPKKNPSEVPLPKTSNIEGGADLINDGTMRKALNAIADAADVFVKQFREPEERAREIDFPRQIQAASAKVESSLDAITELAERLRNAKNESEMTSLTSKLEREIATVKRLRDVPTRT